MVTAVGVDSTRVVTEAPHLGQIKASGLRGHLYFGLEGATWVLE